MNHPDLKLLEYRGFRTLDRLIEERGIEVRCYHCKSTNLQALGWLRGRAEMNCPGCDELIILDTSELRRTIVTTTRQLRAFSDLLHSNEPSWWS